MNEVPVSLCLFLPEKNKELDTYFVSMCFAFGPQNLPSHLPCIALAMASTDRDILLVLYRLAGGANWRESTNWGTDAALSDWFGVKVNDKGSVVELCLESNNLGGE